MTRELMPANVVFRRGRPRGEGGVMADISMCLNDDCPSAKKCYRHEAPVNPHWQCYDDLFKPDDGSQQCGWFIPIAAKEKE